MKKSVIEGKILPYFIKKRMCDIKHEMLLHGSEADKGYEGREEILACIVNGVIPNVALKYDTGNINDSRIVVQQIGMSCNVLKCTI